MVIQHRGSLSSAQSSWLITQVKSCCLTSLEAARVSVREDRARMMLVGYHRKGRLYGALEFRLQPVWRRADDTSSFAGL
jgi:hypothetical protein